MSRLLACASHACTAQQDPKPFTFNVSCCQGLLRFCWDGSSSVAFGLQGASRHTTQNSLYSHTKLCHAGTLLGSAEMCAVGSKKTVKEHTMLPVCDTCIKDHTLQRQVADLAGVLLGSSAFTARLLKALHALCL